MDIHNLLGIMLTNKYTKNQYFHLSEIWKNLSEENFARAACHHHPAASIGINLKYQLCLTKIVNISLVIKIC